MLISKSILAVTLATSLLLTIPITIVISLLSIYITNHCTSVVINTKSLRIAIIGAGINAGLTLLDSNLFSSKNIFIYEANTNISGHIHTRLWLPDNQTLKYVDYNQAQFDTLKNGTNTKLNLQFSKRFWYDLSADGIIYTDLPFLNSWEESIGETYGTSFTPRTGFDVISSSPGNVKGAISASWFDKYFLGSYAAYTLGQYSTIHSYKSVKQGNIHFAGDYTSIDYFSLMEGGASEGERAANEIINDYR